MIIEFLGNKIPFRPIECIVKCDKCGKVKKNKIFYTGIKEDDDFNIIKKMFRSNWSMYFENGEKKFDCMKHLKKRKELK